MRRALLLAALLVAGVAGASPILPSAPALAEDAATPAKVNFIPIGDFTVNLPLAGHRTGYLLISVTVQATNDAAASIQAMMPRYKEAVMRELMVMSDRHILQPDQTDPLIVKDALMAVISKLQPSGVQDVLITRLLYT
ncbi:MAG TPA: flagellar basal body-associated FliL family protein [Acetobacteraceae bacterium]|nr:flagellar basal body-associated FliL family protein [Acetobacteraceae bacterium]